MQAFEKSDDYSGTEYLVKLMELPKDIHKSFFESDFEILRFFALTNSYSIKKEKIIIKKDKKNRLRKNNK